MAEFASRYDGFLLDLWGVLHDGHALYPGVHPCLERLRGQGKGIVLISNAPRRAFRARKVLQTLGIEDALYDGLITSGEVAYHYLANTRELGNAYLFIGPDRDADVLDGLDYQRVQDSQNADFLLNAGFARDDETLEDWNARLLSYAELELPMLCLNPDREVVRLNGQRLLCAGLLAERYAALGQRVRWFGKPYPEIYAEALAMLNLPKQRVLAVGDSLHTDIAGGKEAGVDTALVTGGILASLLRPGQSGREERLRALCEREGVAPDYVLPGFIWAADGARSAPALPHLPS